MKACAACKGRYDDGIPERKPETADVSRDAAGHAGKADATPRRPRVYKIPRAPAAVRAMGLILVLWMLGGCTELGLGTNPIQFLGKVGEASFGGSHAVAPDPVRVVPDASGWLRVHAQAIRDAD